MATANSPRRTISPRTGKPVAGEPAADGPIRAVVLGGHVCGLGIARSLGDVVERCEVWDRTRRSLSRVSRFVSAFRELDILSEDAMRAELLALARSEAASGGRTFIFPTEDITAGILSRNREILLDAGLVPVVDDWARVQRFYYKEQTYKLADELGIPRPRSVLLDDSGRLGDEVRYPLILKPNVIATFHGRFHRKAVLCSNEAEFIANFRLFAGDGSGYRLMAQELIPGSARHQYSLGMLRLDGKTVAGITVCRKRQYPTDFGTGTYVETSDVPKLREYGEALLDAVGYSGICEVEFKFDERDGQLKLFEVNPRLYKWHALGLQLGLNYPRMVIDATLGRPIEGRFVTSRERRVAWYDVFSDLAASARGLRTGDVTLAELARDLRTSKRDSVFAVSDLRPFLYLVRLLPQLARGGRDAL
jgi:D-aspartate ligase